MQKEDKLSLVRTNIFHVLLFTTIGLLAYLMLSNASNLRSDAILLSEFIWGYIFFVLAFNIIGFMIIRLSRWVGYYMVQRWRMVLLYLCVAAVLLFTNYTLIVLAKMLVGVNTPYYFPNGGERVLIILWLLELIIVALLVINHSVMQNMRIRQETARLHEENNKAKYVALQRQLNPHFLFNSLNTLIAEIEYDPINAVKFTCNLSDAYRYVLQCQDKMLITIKQELEFMNSYIFLHRVRIGDYITVEIDIQDSYLEAQVPPLTLQLLIENVIKHNIISESKPMHINIHIEDGSLVITNSLNRRKSVSEGGGMGLNNLSNRSKLIMGRDIQVSANDSQFTVKVPVIYE
ncbi:MAG: sensor histidine kinase [Bacteroidales bacterium]